MAKRSAVRITKRVVDALGPMDVVWDAEVKGFGIRCQGTRKSYVLKTKIAGRQKWITIGRHGSPWTPDTARSHALKLLGLVASGQDPTDDKADERVQISELCSRYLTQYAAQKKKASSTYLDRKNIENHLIPLLGSKSVGALKATDVEAFKVAVHLGKTAPKDPKAKRKEQGGGVVVRGGPGVANRCLTLLSKMMNLAELWGMRPKASNPVRGVARYKEKPKERFLSAEEFLRFGSALDELERQGEISLYAIAAFRLLAFTGARRGEIQNLKWEHVQLEYGRLRLPDSKGGTAKSILLPEEAIDLLKGLPRIDGNPYVIAGSRKGSSLKNMFRPWTQIMKMAELTGVRIHDLRHSFASMAVQNGTSLTVVGELLGHKNVATTKRYAHFEDRFLAQESGRIGKILTTAMTSKKPNLEGSSPEIRPDTNTDDAG